MITLGATAKDIVTGFEGIVTARAQYITGCDQYVLTPKARGTAPGKGEWFDENRLQVTKAALVVIPTKGNLKPGGPATGTAAPMK